MLSVLNSMFTSRLVNTLVTHANKKGFGLASLFGARHGYMPPQFKKNVLYELVFFVYFGLNVKTETPHRCFCFSKDTLERIWVNVAFILEYYMSLHRAFIK